jgi:hypothetical protein
MDLEFCFQDSMGKDIMDVSPIAATATALSGLQVQSQIAVSVLKKAIDLESAGALQLLQALPSPTPVSAGAAGGAVDVWA